ncbi:hypothetical protein ACJJTC_004426 [Scirpophaga incertulas]
MEPLNEIKYNFVQDSHLDIENENEKTNEVSSLKKGEIEDTAKDNDNEDKKKVTLIERLKIIKKNVTVEPIMACYVMPSVLSSLAVQNLNLEKACRVNLNYSSEICDALELRQTANYSMYENEVQTLIATIQGWKNVVQTAIPVMLILFVGAWSDKVGKRKACILMPIVGEFMTCIGFMLNTYFFYELPVEVAALTESNISSYNWRLVHVLRYPIGSALSGVILRWVGYYGVFAISGSLYFFSLMYGIFYLEDSKKKVEVKTTTFRVAFRKGPGNRRLRVSLLLIVVCVVFGPLHGEFMILYLFTRYRFNWNEVQYSVWSTFSIITNLVGTALSMAIFSKHMKLDDTLLAIISSSSKIVSAFAYAFARNNLEIYIAPILEMLNGTSFIAMRSIATKLVSGEEFGKVNSLFGLAEAMMPLVYGPMYSQVYTATLQVLPGAVFLLGAALTAPAIAIFVWLYYENKKDIIRNKEIKSNSLLRIDEKD